MGETFAEFDGPLADEARRRAEPQIDDFAESWVAAHAQACLDAPNARMLDARMLCLHGRRAKLDATLRAFERV